MSDTGSKGARDTVHDATERVLDRWLRFPTRKVIGIIDTPAHLEAALAALEAAGIAREATEVFSGEKGIRAIDPHGRYAGLLGRLTRIFQALGEEHEHLHRYEDELRAGHYLVVVPAENQKAAERAAAILREHGGHFVDYYGPLAIYHLVP